MNKRNVIQFLGKNHPLSNFYEAHFDIDGIVYPTVEHYYQSEKCINIQDKIKITITKEAKDAKRLGRKVKCKKDWNLVKKRVMWKALNAKFSQNIRLKEYLLNTGDCYLIEKNKYDEYWGIGGGGGKNIMGRLLILLRRKYKNECKL